MPPDPQVFRDFLLPTLLACGVLAAAGCARDSGHTGSGMFNQPPRPTAATLDDARRIDEVQRIYRDGLFDKARAAVDKLIAEGSGHPQVFFLKATLTRQAGDDEGAIPWCNRAIGASPQWIEPRILLARIYLKLERWTSATQIFADIDRLAPSGPWGPYGQGAVALMRGDRATAQTFFDTALQRDPDHLPSLGSRAQLARLAADAAVEERTLSRIAGLEPLDPDVRVRLGELAMAAGRNEDASRQLLRAYELDASPEIAQKLAALARRTGDVDGERLWTRRAGVATPADQDPAPVQ